VGILVGLLFGIFEPNQILHFPGPFKISGLLPKAISGALPTVAFLMVMFPFLGIMEASGTLDMLGNGLSKVASGPRSVEAVTVGATGALAMITGVISVAIISIGDIVKNLGLKFDVNGYRRANLMDCAGSAFCFIVPWTVHAIVPSMLASANNPLKTELSVSPASVPMHNFYAWTMLVMLIFAIISGYGRTWMSNELKK
jgi:Na+/H+ antiporter NhaC